FRRRKPDQSLPVRSWQGTDFEPQLDRSIPAARQPERSEPPLSRDWDEADDYAQDTSEADDDIARLIVEETPAGRARVAAPAPRPAPSARHLREAQTSFLPTDGFELPPLDLLAAPCANQLLPEHHPDALEDNA